VKNSYGGLCAGHPDYADESGEMPLHTRSTPCPSCGSAETLRVEIALAASPVSFTSCSTCEWKGWERGGESLPLGSVLGLVATR
jgi:hypothetical protein